jgi:hypothetical protein
MKKVTGYVFPAELLTRAIELRSEGYQWKDIENIFSEAGHRAPNGQPYYNGLISAQVLRDPRGAHLRVRTLTKKKKRKGGRKPGSKNKPKGIDPQALAKYIVETAGSQTGLTKFGITKPKAPTVSDQIEALKKVGLTDSQILVALSTK